LNKNPITNISKTWHPRCKEITLNPGVTLPNRWTTFSCTLSTKTVVPPELDTKSQLISDIKTLDRFDLQAMIDTWTLQKTKLSISEDRSDVQRVEKRAQDFTDSSTKKIKV
jgi:hypothetical protein